MTQRDPESGVSGVKPSMLRRVRGWLAFGVYGASLGALVLGVWACQGPSGGSSSSFERLPVDGSSADLRVRLVGPERAVTLGGAGTWKVGVEGAGSTKTVPGPVRVAGGRGAVRVVDATGRVHGFARGSSVSLLPEDGVGDLGGKTYRGTFVAVPRGAQEPDRIDVISVVDVESYLPGVVAQELYESWPLEAYRAQAVAARSYALSERAKARDRGRYYDLEDDQRDQAYLGLTDRPVALESVRSTRGIVLTAYDRIMPAFYSSTCGGRAALAEEIWPEQSSVNFRLVSRTRGVKTDRPHACQSAPLYRWRVVRSRDALSGRLRAWGRANDDAALAGFDRLHMLSVAERSSSGRPLMYRLTDVRGRSAEIGAERLRGALNASVPGTDRVPASDRVRSNDFDFRVNGSRVTILGRGFGHGVGLCQYCAKTMAQRGRDAEEMLGLFYPTAELRRAY
ncbi:MAG: SpoIID/LytB domain-containing protein [Planctomycetota bacterium]